MYDCTHKHTYGHVCSFGLTRAHAVCRRCQLCLACLFLFVCSWWPTRCCLPASTCRGCLWGFSPSAPRGKSSCKPATASRRGCDWRMRTRNRWGVNLHTHTQNNRMRARWQGHVSTLVERVCCEIFSASWEVFFLLFFLKKGFRCQCILTTGPQARSNYDSSYLRREQLLWHMHWRHTFHPLCAHLHGAI